MKTIKNIPAIFSFCFILFVSVFAVAQNSTNNIPNNSKLNVKDLIDSNCYVFEATFANPMSGRSWPLTSEYTFTVTKDTLIAYLPYFGRAYFAPMDPTEGGIKFTSTKFDYTTHKDKKGRWQIFINTKDTKTAQHLILDINEDGYASLRINSIDRDPIIFDGYVEGIVKKG